MATKKKSTTEPTLDELFDADLAERGLTRQDATDRGITVADANVVRQMRIHPAKPAIVIPYFDALSDRRLEIFRGRYFDPPLTKGKLQRYSQPPGTGTEAYFDPTRDWPKIFKDHKIDIYITEGEFKAIVMNKHGLVTIGLGGVDSYGGETLTPLLQKIKWKGRNVFIVYDSDAATNENVRRAAEKLAEVLS
ncbi:DUF3854 domain-containing protein [Granulicella sp. S190]|uniref:DUF3854 domain-containing protein n=1 Tax=Granulicella sp. S190 TaxID=1747226 RepID=UPI00131CA4CC|nr:DUF3854 domain-containing protein [Granulicella sp. S190]